MRGPFETERDALASVEPIVGRQASALGAAAARQLLEKACTSAGIQLGAFDRQVLLRLTGQPLATCAVLASLIGRAAAAAPPAYQLTLRQAVADAIRWRQGNGSADDQDQTGLYEAALREVPGLGPDGGAR